MEMPASLWECSRDVWQHPAQLVLQNKWLLSSHLVKMPLPLPGLYKAQSLQALASREMLDMPLHIHYTHFVIFINLHRSLQLQAG